MNDADRGTKDGRLADLYQRAASVTAGAAVGSGIGGPGGAIAGAALGVLLEPLAEKVWGELRGDSQQRQCDALTAAQEAMGLDPEELEQRVLSFSACDVVKRSGLPGEMSTSMPPRSISAGSSSERATRSATVRPKRRALLPFFRCQTSA
jgi:hypothetical protein